MSVVETIDACEVEQEFFTDIFCTIYSSILGRFSGWPQRKDLGLLISEWKGKLTVGYNDLHSTGFRDPSAIGSFLRYYGKYDFLQPVAVGRYGKQEDTKENREHEALARLIEHRLTVAFHIKVPTLKEHAMMATWTKDRRQNRHSGSLLSNGRQARSGSGSQLREYGQDVKWGSADTQLGNCADTGNASMPATRATTGRCGRARYLI